MRPLKSHFPAHALTTLDTILKQTKEARVFHRAQAVRAVVAGQHVSTVSMTFHLANSAVRKWVQRFAQQGPQGLLDRPRSGRPPKVTCELAQHLNRLVDEDPLQHGALSSQWNCRELATVLAQQTGVHLGRESIRTLLKKRRKLQSAHGAARARSRRAGLCPS
jgi:transposase